MKMTVLQSKETKNENRYCKLDIPVPIYIVYIRHTFRVGVAQWVARLTRYRSIMSLKLHQ